MTANKVDHDQFFKKAKRIVQDHYNYMKDLSAPAIELEEIYIVWFCKTLGNWKALLSTDIVDGRYYEVTYNGAMLESYLDVYAKVSNFKIIDNHQEY